VLLKSFDPFVVLAATHTEVVALAGVKCTVASRAPTCAEVTFSAMHFVAVTGQAVGATPAATTEAARSATAEAAWPLYMKADTSSDVSTCTMPLSTGSAPWFPRAEASAAAVQAPCLTYISVCSGHQSVGLKRRLLARLEGLVDRFGVSPPCGASSRCRNRKTKIARGPVTLMSLPLTTIP
jgi:hypothetical protein